MLEHGVPVEMAEIDEGGVMEALRGVTDPASGRDIVSAGLVSGVTIRGANAGFAIEVAPSEAEKYEPVRRAAEQAVRALPGVSSATAVLTAHRVDPRPAPERPAPERPATARPAPPGRQPLDLDVRAIIAVASGKGGVGKSTVAANLAAALAERGLAVGLLDADIYGPSVPRMLGLKGKPESPDGKRLQPIEAHGLKAMSIGLLIDEETPIIWRGPMVMGALEQLLRDVNWGRLDVLVVDMPPGTGDTQLTMAQRVPLAGAVIVSTPQDIALLDARRGLAMFRRVNVPILGIVENMSYFSCPSCGHRTEIFAHGGAARQAEAEGVPFLGAIPLDMAIREASDAGSPLVKSAPESPHAEAFRALAAAVAERLFAGERPSPAAPRIVMR